MALAIALPRANRHRHALLIFVPLLILGLLWERVTTLTGMPSESRAQFSFLGEFLAAGIALLWLNADKLGRLRRLARLAAGLGLLLLTDLMVTLSYWGSFPGQTDMFIVFVPIIAVILLLALALTRWLTRRRYRPVRFMLWLAVWNSVCSVAGAAVFVGVLMLTAESINNWPDVFTEIVVPGLVLGLCLYAVNLPYLLLMFTSPFFRRRFQIWLGAQSVRVGEASFQPPTDY